MNNKETLIKMLRGEVKHMQSIIPLLEDISIMDETDHVDTDFLNEILVSVNSFMGTSNTLMEKITSLMLCPGIDARNGTNKTDNGKELSAESLLKLCTLEDNILRLPKIQFNKKSYSKVNQYIEEAGGQWVGGKTQGFTFPFKADRVFSILKNGERCNLQQDFQFFETPDIVADWLVMLAGGIHENDTVLEPSAGRGAIIRAIHRLCNVRVDCYELMPENREILSTMNNISIRGGDFINECNESYSKIIANPPFCNNQDIEHVQAMYKYLSPGGTLVAITSPHWQLGNEKKCTNFRAWLEQVEGEICDIQEGVFKESGTSIGTKVIIIKKDKL
jgi:hypothetical protein